MSQIIEPKRGQVRARANRRCEYCNAPEGYSVQKHHADHIIAQKHDGDDDLDNLAWACFSCNIHKGADISGYDSETKLLTPLFNPRTQRWHEHFKMEDGYIIGLTAVGRVTVKVLKMNSVRQLAFRRTLLKDGLWE